MKLLKALNNNVALVLDDEKRESVVMGRGVAFHVKIGQHIDSSLVERSEERRVGKECRL